MRRVVDNVVDETEVAINKVVPRARLMVEAALDELTINRGKSHDPIPCLVSSAW
jgi:hypothetical protein